MNMRLLPFLMLLFGSNYDELLPTIKQCHAAEFDDASSLYGLDGVKNVQGGELKNDDQNNVNIAESAFFKSPHSKDQNEDTGYYDNFLISTEQQDYFLSTSSQFDCQPRQIHLTLGDESQTDYTSMTVSFSLPSSLYQNNDTSSTTMFCHPEQVVVSISYQKITNNNNGNDNRVKPNFKTKQYVVKSGSYNKNDDNRTSTTMLLSNENETNRDDNNNNIISSSSLRSVVNQYKIKSPLTNETYTSDWLYHVQLDDLDADSLYSYSIHIYQRHPQTKNEQYNGSYLRSKENTSFAAGTFYENAFLTNTKRKLDQKRVNGEMIIIGLTPEFTFKTPPKVSRSKSSISSDSIKPTKFAIVGDLGQTYNSSITMLNMLSETKINSETNTPVSLILCAGDMSYANSIQPQWDSWFTLIEPLISQTPIIVAAGNHEIECDVNSRLPFIPYENRFRMPNRIQNADVGVVDEVYFESKWGCATPSRFQGHYDYGNAFYSFTYGLVKTIVLSSYSETNSESVQYKWLENELKNNVDRNITPWIIVMMHTQFYTTFQGHDDEFQTKQMRLSMEPLFYKYGVNFVFSGHDHAYMRTKNIFNHSIDENGPVYFIVGEGGNREHHVKNYLHDIPEEWIEVRDKSVYGFGTLEIMNRTNAQWKWIMDANNDGLAFSDNVWLSNNFYLKH